MKKTLQKCKEIIAKGHGWDEFNEVLRRGLTNHTQLLTDLANKMYYEQSEDFYCKDFTEDGFLSNDEKCKNQCAACRNKSLPNHPQLKAENDRLKAWMKNRIATYKQFLKDNPNQKPVYDALISELETILFTQITNP